MQPHVKAYFKHFGYDQSDRIGCEYCGSFEGVEIHHVEPRSKFGSKTSSEKDDISNLIALCRLHHDAAHGPNSREYKTLFKFIIERR
jgi:hypothetical protein